MRNDLPVLEDSIRKAASTIRQIKEEIDLGEIAQLLGGDIKSKSDFLANPVVLKENKLYPIPNYGSAMTPFMSYFPYGSEAHCLSLFSAQVWIRGANVQKISIVFWPPADLPYGGDSSGAGGCPGQHFYFALLCGE